MMLREHVAALEVRYAEQRRAAASARLRDDARARCCCDARKYMRTRDSALLCYGAVDVGARSAGALWQCAAPS